MPGIGVGVGTSKEIRPRLCSPLLLLCLFGGRRSFATWDISRVPWGHVQGRLGALRVRGLALVMDLRPNNIHGIAPPLDLAPNVPRHHCQECFRVACCVHE